MDRREVRVAPLAWRMRVEPGAHLGAEGRRVGVVVDGEREGQKLSRPKRNWAVMFAAG